MSQQFDSSLRFLFSLQPESWLRLIDVEAKHAEVCSVDLSTVSSQADALLLIEHEGREAVHFELQSSYDATMGERLLRYNVLARKVLEVPVRSVVVLLRPSADGSAMNGRFKYFRTDGKPYLDFRFDVVRVWQIPAERMFDGGLGVLPFAFIAKHTERELKSIVERVAERLKHETLKHKRADFWTAVDIVMGLRYSRQFVDDLLKGVLAMEDSVTYQAIIQKGVRTGRAEGVALGERSVLLRLGTKRFGPPDSQTKRVLNAIKSVSRLEELADRILSAKSWTELLS